MDDAFAQFEACGSVKPYSSKSLLEHIDSAQDVRALPKEALPQLCSEVRQCLIDTVSRTAGHLASGLGVVELTVALHYVFNTPDDQLVWDVGHQAYPHKLLTGHRKEFSTIRQKGGIHAFIWRGETPYDLITTGHASTSIGSALGLALAQRAKPKEQRRKVVAVIGDGALSGGCAFEALNHAGSFKDLDLTIILNDNEMSISENVGSLAQGLSHVISSPHYVKMVEGGKRILKSLPTVRDLALRAQEHVKGMLMPGTLFEEFGFNYIGPVDGHDINRLVSILQNIRDMPGLKFLHVVTKKGKGYDPAEKDPICYHGVPTFDPEQGIDVNKKCEDLSYSAAFGRWLCDKAATDKKLMAITPAMRIGAGMNDFASKYPDQFFDVAIAEQHAMVLASGLAAGGLHPIVSIYSSFLQRAYDGVIHDMAVQDLPIVLAIDRGGVVGPDGPTHNGAFDIAFTRTVPNLLIMAPASRQELYFMLNTAYDYGHPAIVRYPRSNGESFNDEQVAQNLSLDHTYTIGQVECVNLASFHKQMIKRLDKEDKEAKLALLSLKESQIQEQEEDISKDELSKHKVAILAFGPVAYALAKSAKDHDYTLINMRFIKPLNEQLISYLSTIYDQIFTVEEGARLGGIGEHISAICCNELKSKAKVHNLGLEDHFIMEDSRDRILAEQQIDSLGVIAQIQALLDAI